MPTHQELPEQFGRYRILKKLGAGGMGAVYLAEDTRLQRQVALKVPHFTPGTRAPVLERFQREARLAASIEHPNFCPVHDVDEIDGIHFFTMAYLEGTPLSDLLVEEQPWPQHQAVAMVRLLALAVGQLHAKGILHRDLKPANVMVRPSGEPVLMDFGLACSLTVDSERLTATGEVMGTLVYMPPEQLDGDRQRLGPATDLYSLGMILYKLLTGRLPFVGQPLHVVAQVGSRVPEPPSTRLFRLDSRLDAVCLKALAKKPEERFPDTSAFVATLDEVLRTPGEEHLKCPQCGKRLTVPAGTGNQPVACPQCGADLTDRTLVEASVRPVPDRWQSIAPTRQEITTRSLPQPRARRPKLLVLLLLMVVGASGLLAALHFWPLPDVGTQPPPPSPLPMASLRLEKPEPVRIQAGQWLTVPLKIWRENCSGPVEVTLAERSPGVEIRSGRVDNESKEGSLEIKVTSDAPLGKRTLRLQLVAADARAEAELELMIQMQMVLIKKGTFRMSSPPKEEGRHNDEDAQHPVKIVRDFYMGATEVTVGQFRQFVRETNHETEARAKGEKDNWEKNEFSPGNHQPVVYVSWNDARAFCKWLSQKIGETYDLPTEAEWEYACRAGGEPEEAYCFGRNPQTLAEYAWYRENEHSEHQTHAVGKKKANQWGLYDMHGNVWEWCKDGKRWYPDKETADKQTYLFIDDPGNPQSGKTRVLRGGSWDSRANSCRSANRSDKEPDTYRYDIGFRVVSRPGMKAP
jgi:formylglycine-generating enzyme required for sulfatase activity/serine/threonine protein kinase